MGYMTDAGRSRTGARALEPLAAFGDRIKVRRGDLIRAEACIIVLESFAAAIRSEEKPRFEVGFLGCGGILGVERVFLPDYPVMAGRALSVGVARMIPFEDVRDAANRSEALTAEVLRLAFYSAASHFERASNVVQMRSDERVARWILEYSEAVQNDELRITHEEIAQALGMRRSSVTDGLHLLEGHHLIRSRRCKIIITQRGALARYGGLRRAEPIERRGVEAAGLAAQG